MYHCILVYRCRDVHMKVMGQLWGVSSLIPPWGFQEWNSSVCTLVPSSAAESSPRPPHMCAHASNGSCVKVSFLSRKMSCSPQIITASLAHLHSLLDPAWPILPSIPCNVSEENKTFGEVFSVNSLLWGKQRNQLMSIHKHPYCGYQKGHGCKQFTVNCLISSHWNEGILSSPNAAVLTALLHQQQERAF